MRSVGGLPLLVALFAVAACEPPPAKSETPSTDEPIAQGRTPSAREFATRQCDDGDDGACTLLGHCYDEGGQGACHELGLFPQDSERAAQFYAKGCKLGNAMSCGRLGRAVLKGIGVQQDATKGAALLVAACDGGYEWACIDAAVALYDGNGVTRDRDRARTLLIRGCVAGVASACDLEKRFFGTSEFSVLDPPEGALGVTFGTSMPDLERRCRAAGHSWKGDSQRGYCSGSLSASVPLPFAASACGGRVCTIMALQWLSDEPVSTWVQHFDALEKELVSKYGPPYERVRVMPAECDESSAFADCLKSKQAAFKATWLWERQVGVLLVILNASKGPEIDIFYQSPEAFREGRVMGL